MRNDYLALLLDLSPPDYFLYPKLKLKMRGQRYESINATEDENKGTERYFSGSVPEGDDGPVYSF